MCRVFFSNIGKLRLCETAVCPSLSMAPTFFFQSLAWQRKFILFQSCPKHLMLLRGLSKWTSGCNRKMRSWLSRNRPHIHLHAEGPESPETFLNKKIWWFLLGQYFSSKASVFFSSQTTYPLDALGQITPRSAQFQGFFCVVIRKALFQDALSLCYWVRINFFGSSYFFFFLWVDLYSHENNPFWIRHSQGRLMPIIPLILLVLCFY